MLIRIHVEEVERWEGGDGDISSSLLIAPDYLICMESIVLESRKGQVEWKATLATGQFKVHQVRTALLVLVGIRGLLFILDHLSGNGWSGGP